jgi:hypothetical protein
MMRALLVSALLCASLLFPASHLFAQAQDYTGPETVYHPLQGEAAPVAPPLRKGSPLWHLANDPKLTQLPVGFREGHTDSPDFFIAHRSIDPDGGFGWGWVKKNGQDWDDAKWIALQETLGVAEAPHRKLLKADMDQDWEYKFWGTFAPYKAYDPHLDEQLPVFVLQGWEVIGLAAPLQIHAGPPGRPHSRASGASSRSNRPIMNDPGVD